MAKRVSILSINSSWPVPDNVVAVSSFRYGGVSDAPYNNFNMALHVGDDSAAVLENRRRLTQSCDGLESIQWLNQVHGTTIVDASTAPQNSQKIPVADACYTSQASLACAVLTADCLPLLICDSRGTEVAAVHAGWRGLNSGVIEVAVRRFSTPAKDLLVWMGPAIGPAHFEVGAEVRDAFLNAAPMHSKNAVANAFKASVDSPAHYFASLYELARIHLKNIGVLKVSGGDACCYEQRDRFFSYRREEVTGRMATLIYRRG